MRNRFLCWKPPPKGCLMLNACGLIYEGAVGSGGVQSYDEGITRALFSGPSKANEDDIVEVGAI